MAGVADSLIRIMSSVMATDGDLNVQHQAEYNSISLIWCGVVNVVTFQV